MPVDKAIQMASLNPAKLLEIDESKGSLESGKDADFNVLRKNLSVKNTYISAKKMN
jgi:N-acetylglucosamine-6-phosphate deacetylase